MQKLNFPSYNLKLKREKGQVYIMDTVRKKYLLLTPEEWVRQHIISYLSEEKKYPQALFSIEAGIKVNTLKKRYDALVYSRNGTPLVLIECKAPEVKITPKVFEQIINYNREVRAPFLIITNGLEHFFLQINNKAKKFEFVKNIPEYNSLITK